jgi:DNA modification methylase
VVLYNSDALGLLNTLPSGYIHCCVTSPPYWGLRDYGVEGQIGLETSPEEYVNNLVIIFREVKRVMRDDGTVWLNLGDSYAGSGKGLMGDGTHSPEHGTKQGTNQGTLDLVQPNRPETPSLKPKDLVGIPWRVAFALQADGWWLRQDIIWAKPNPMPESVTDRCTKSHEYIFLLSKSAKYYYDADAIKEMAEYPNMRHKSSKVSDAQSAAFRGNAPSNLGRRGTSDDGTRNRRDVWTIPTHHYKGAHFATFPPDLIRPCILAGCPRGGKVLDPFSGSGTTGMVSRREGRKCIMNELSESYCELSLKRIIEGGV